MNTDLNLGPSQDGSAPAGASIPSLEEEAINYDIQESLHSRPSLRLRHSQQYRGRWRQVHGYAHPLLSRHSDIFHPHSGSVLSTSWEDVGEGSNTAAEIRNREAPEDRNRIDPENRNREDPEIRNGEVSEIRNGEVVKICDNKNKNLTDRDKNAKSCKKVEEDTIKASDISGGGFFDCNICLDLAKEPVVTGCGHLFCWPCLYKWLYIHSCVKECPICKGTVSTDCNVTPIYGRGRDSIIREPDEDNSGIKIPERPPAKGRIEHKRPSVMIPSTESFIQHDYDRHFNLLNMFEQVREQNRVDMLDLYTQSALISGTMPDPNISETERRVISHNHRRSDSYYGNGSNASVMSQRIPTLADQTFAEIERRVISRNRRTLDSYYGNGSNASVMFQLIPSIADQTTTTMTRADDESLLQPQQDPEPFQLRVVDESSLQPQRDPEPSQLIDDRDSSLSSVVAAIHGEIDPSTSLSTSSSRRRRNDMDSGDSRNSRRRRPN